MDRLTRWRRHWCVAPDGGRITGLIGTALDPSAIRQFADVVRGLVDGCAALGVPVTGGNFSFYNSTGAGPTATSAGSRRRSTTICPIAGSQRRSRRACSRTTGARIALPFDLEPFETLFSDSAARAVVAVRARAELRVREFCEATGVPYTAIGTTGGDALHVGDLFGVRLHALRAVHEATFPVAFER